MRKRKEKTHIILGKKYQYGSHMPVNRAVIDIFPITGVVELGAGIWSTAFFFENCDNVLTIEADKKWRNEVLENISESKTKSIVYHDLKDNGISVETKPHNISKEVAHNVLSFYRKQIALAGNNFNFLFVDQYKSLRTMSLNSLHEDFDFIVFHDTEAVRTYGYRSLEFNSDNYIHLRYNVIPTTDILINKKYSDKIDAFLNALRKRHIEFLNQIALETSDFVSRI